MYAILHKGNDKISHLEESIHYIQDSELIQFLWRPARAVLSPPPPGWQETTLPGAFLPAHIG